jgi:hypothetical protein
MRAATNREKDSLTMMAAVRQIVLDKASEQVGEGKITDTVGGENVVQVPARGLRGTACARATSSTRRVRSAERCKAKPSQASRPQEAEEALVGGWYGVQPGRLSY